MDDTTFVNDMALKSILGIPTSWINREGKAGRLPCIRVGRRLLFHREACLRILEDRALGNVDAQHPEQPDSEKSGDSNTKELRP